MRPRSAYARGGLNGSVTFDNTVTSISNIINRINKMDFQAKVVHHISQ
ncbi:hypothetical protein [Virgibacillus ihumii]|nr:hypothetical protein [Virgibacillus ihumii]